MCSALQVSRTSLPHRTDPEPSRWGFAGFTGRLITQYLYNHPQQSTFTFAIGVRSKAKADTLRQSLGLDDSVPFVELDVASYAQVEAAVKGAKVVINTVGPFWLWGTNVVR